MTIFANHNYVVALEEDPNISSAIEGATGARVEVFKNLDALLKEADKIQPLAVFVGENSVGSIARLRAAWAFAPILLVTSARDVETIGEALASGADDFVSKPINPIELTFRYQVRASEKERDRAKLLKRIGDVEINLRENAVIGGGKTLHLSRNDIGLLAYLVDARGSVIPRQELKRHCWGGVSVSDKALDRKIHLLRSALSDISDLVRIRSVYGAGFRMEGFRSRDVD
jgi:DNA-binding response OmpR family regulator